MSTHTHFEITKVDAFDHDAMCDAYTYLMGCSQYRNLTKSDFDKCENNIYLALDASFPYDSTVQPLGIIGVRRATMDELGLKEMEFYPLPDQYLYSIDFIHMSMEASKFNVLGRYLGYSSILIALLDQALSDKNDSFSFLKLKCPKGKTSNMHDSLIDFGFRIEDYNRRTETYTYLRMPRMYLNV